MEFSSQEPFGGLGQVKYSKDREGGKIVKCDIADKGFSLISDSFWKVTIHYIIALVSISN